MFDKEDLLYVIGYAEDEISARIENADDQDASEPGWGDDDRKAARECETYCALLTKHADAIVALVNKLEAERSSS